MLAITCAVSALAAAQGPVSTGWTYQGQLKDTGSPATGLYDMIFALYDAASGGSRTGPLLAFDGIGGNPPAVTIVDGLFTVELDFGTGIFTGDALWLQIAVRPTKVGQYALLDPRQPLTAAPYALFALSGPGSGGSWQANGADIFNNNSGNVGIGTTMPQSLLQVGQGDEASIRLGLNPQLLLERDVANNIFRIQLTGSGYGGNVLQIGRDDQTHDIAMMGNVGIGTTPPRTTLDVFGEDAVLRVESIRTDSGPKLVFRNRTTGSGITNGTIQFQDANNTLAWIKYHRPGAGAPPALHRRST